MRAFLLLTLVLLIGCSTREVPLPNDNIPSDAVREEIFVATMRDGTDLVGLFGSDRSAEILYGRVTTSVPPNHQVGVIESPSSGQPDPSEHFALERIERFEGGKSQFLSTMRREGAGERILFVHGYNMTPADAVLQATQIKHDFGIDRPVTAFAWPSAGDVRGYVYDRDSVLFSRTELTDTIRGMTQRSSTPLLIMAHSMGSLLTMESLRQMALEGDRRTLNRLSGVVLVSPDIEPDVFRRQVLSLGNNVPQPFIIFASQNDGALRISSLLTQRSRLGSIQDATQLEGLPITILDVTDFGDSGELNHDIALTSPAAIQLALGVRDGDQDSIAALSNYLVLEGNRGGRGGVFGPR